LLLGPIVQAGFVAVMSAPSVQDDV
jgi:hypothetical protein